MSDETTDVELDVEMQVDDGAIQTAAADVEVDPLVVERDEALAQRDEYMTQRDEYKDIALRLQADFEN